jgi:hypothetical protein
MKKFSIIFITLSFFFFTQSKATDSDSAKQRKVSFQISYSHNFLSKQLVLDNAYNSKVEFTNNPVIRIVGLDVLFRLSPKFSIGTGIQWGSLFTHNIVSTTFHSKPDTLKTNYYTFTQKKQLLKVPITIQFRQDLYRRKLFLQSSASINYEIYNNVYVQSQENGVVIPTLASNKGWNNHLISTNFNIGLSWNYTKYQSVGILYNITYYPFKNSVFIGEASLFDVLLKYYNFQNGFKLFLTF